MYTPLLRNHYESILARLLGSNKIVKSSRLLQAYVTFSEMLSGTHQDLTDAYNDIRNKYADYPYAILPLSPRQCKDIQVDKLKEFTDISFGDFLLYVIPDVVCDPRALLEHYREYIIDHELSEPQLAHQIIAIKLNSYQNIASNKHSTATPESPPKVHDGLGGQIHQNTGNDSFSSI